MTQPVVRPLIVFLYGPEKVEARLREILKKQGVADPNIVTGVACDTHDLLVEWPFSSAGISRLLKSKKRIMQKSKPVVSLHLTREIAQKALVEILEACGATNPDICHDSTDDYDLIISGPPFTTRDVQEICKMTGINPVWPNIRRFLSPFGCEVAPKRKSAIT